MTLDYDSEETALRSLDGDSVLDDLAETVHTRDLPTVTSAGARTTHLITLVSGDLFVLAGARVGEVVEEAGGTSVAENAWTVPASVRTQVRKAAGASLCSRCRAGMPCQAVRIRAKRLGLPVPQQRSHAAMPRRKE